MAKMQLSKLNRIPPRSSLLFMVSAMLFFVLLTAVINLGKKYAGLKDKLTELNQEKASLEQKKQELSEENGYLESPEGEEYLLREKYQLVKPGEGLIVITGPDEKRAEEVAPKKGFQRFWDTLLHGLGVKAD